MNRPDLAGLHGEGQKRPLYSRLPILYSLTPPWIRSLGRAFAAFQRGNAQSLIDRYLAVLEKAPAGDGKPVPVLLTHDIDTAAGLATLPTLLAAEEKLGLSSLCFLVTHRYPLDKASLTRWTEKGHRFGVHDTNHDNRIAYEAPESVRARIARAQGALGALDTCSFRSPAFLRSRSLYDGIAGAVRYDFSSIDSALAWPFPGDGTGSPFPIRHQGILCAPTNMPRDGELLALGLSASQKLALCRRKAEQLRRVGAPVIFLTHPDPGFTDSASEISGYADFLKWLATTDGFEILPPQAFLASLPGRATGEL